ncbi:hypothetical protein ACQEVG_07225 [Streptomyces sp. CA-135486]|uniref:hypothetical protein n=1 Tax=Streptomyces sp. CA-135486 TaxID=3240049 RepID=UPI003D8F9031
MGLGKLGVFLKALIGMAATIGLLLFGATSASAHPGWQTYSANSNWKCGPSKSISISNYVVFQTCLITTPDKTKAQLVVVVSNRSDKTVELKGAAFDSDIYGGYDWDDDLGAGFCGYHELAAGQARGCFGDTVGYGCGLGLTHHAYIYANNSGPDWTTAFSTDHYC